MAKKTHEPPTSIKAKCHHCGNLTLQNKVLVQNGEVVQGQAYDENYREQFQFVIFACSTCECPNVYGNNEYMLNPGKRTIDKYEHLYPERPILPDSVPDRIVSIYEEIFHLQHQAPNAFANQIRRALEFICTQQKAEGRDLYQKLENLHTQGKIPTHIKDFGHLIRDVGNIGSHASKNDLDVGDAELLNDFFLIVVEYIYIAPQKVKELKKRLKSLKTKK